MLKQINAMLFPCMVELFDAFPLSVFDYCHYCSIRGGNFDEGRLSRSTNALLSQLAVGQTSKFGVFENKQCQDILVLVENNVVNNCRI